MQVIILEVGDSWIRVVEYVWMFDTCWRGPIGLMKFVGGNLSNSDISCSLLVTEYLKSQLYSQVSQLSGFLTLKRTDSWISFNWKTRWLIVGAKCCITYGVILSKYELYNFSFKYKKKFLQCKCFWCIIDLWERFISIWER